MPDQAFLPNTGLAAFSAPRKALSTTIPSHPFVIRLVPL
jgi:hypothetical protein